ncbi:hypothetical protein FRC01_011129 [Tulasnella sp. 417]|nr:hypothetical protein FRC01_011129 [Tulasnella sp. 417]
MNAGLISVGTSWNDPEFEGVSTWGPSSPREWQPGVTFNLTQGQTLRVNVGRRRTYSNRATLLDLIGIAQPPDVIVTYPILSAIGGTPPPSPSLTVLNFYPDFGPYNDEIYEEYLKHTVLSGLSTSGGLYASFDVFFILVFGRSLLAALFGSKHLTPFGAMASLIQSESFRKKLKEEYPGIGDKNRNQRAQATCDFLHDFILDLKPLEIEKLPKEADQDITQMDANSGVPDSEKGTKQPEAIADAVTYGHNNSTGGSA